MSSISPIAEDQTIIHWRQEKSISSNSKVTWMQNCNYNLVIHTVCQCGSDSECDDLDALILYISGRINFTYIPTPLPCTTKITSHSRFDLPKRKEFLSKPISEKWQPCKRCYSSPFCAFADNLPQAVKQYAEEKMREIAKIPLPPSFRPYIIQESIDEGRPVALVAFRSPFPHLTISTKCQNKEQCPEVQKIAQSMFLFLKVHYNPIPFITQCVSYITFYKENKEFPSQEIIRRVFDWMIGLVAIEQNLKDKRRANTL